MEALEPISLWSNAQIRDIESNERERYTLTHPREADIRVHRISTLSPMGNAIYGTSPGDSVELDAPGGTFKVEIETVENVPPLQFARDG
jgi:transcription elongation GreA/GreB family factor